MKFSLLKGLLILVVLQHALNSPAYTVRMIISQNNKVERLWKELIVAQFVIICRQSSSEYSNPGPPK